MKKADGSTPNFEYKFKCRGCGERFIADENDVDVAYFGANYGEYQSREYYVPCPCGRDHIIERQLPEAVRAKADAKEEARKEDKGK